MGEELGMQEQSIPTARLLDPPSIRFWPVWPGRDGCRTPMQWNGEQRNCGFSEAPEGGTWLPMGADAATQHVSAQSEDTSSVLYAYRDAIALRRQYAALAL